MGTTFSCRLEDKGNSNQPGVFFQEAENAQFAFLNKWEKKTVTYCLIRGSDDIPDDTDEYQAVNLAMSTWDFEIPLELKVVKKDDNPDIKIEFTTGKKDPFFYENSGALAFAYYPGTEKQGIIKFNDDKHWSLDGKPTTTVVNNQKKEVPTFNILHTLIHEIGHSLGLSHSPETSSVMFREYTGKLELDPDDRKRIQERYGKRKWAMPEHENRLKNWLSSRIKKFDNPLLETTSISLLKSENEFLKEQVRKKDELIKAQLDVISQLYKKLKK